MTGVLKVPEADFNLWCRSLLRLPNEYFVSWGSPKLKQGYLEVAFTASNSEQPSPPPEAVTLLPENNP
jgi:hypothetical protein